jgi:Fic/DOC family
MRQRVHGASQSDALVLGQMDQGGGIFRTTSARLSGMDYEPPSPADVPPFMQRLSEEIKAGPAGRSVIQFATEVHNKLAAIHPFVDGNGRTARLLINTIPLNSKLPPLGTRGLSKGNLPIEVTLAVSRWVDGSPRYLLNEPVSLREIAYVNGEWFVMKEDGNHKPIVEQVQIKQLFDEIPGSSD